MTVNVLITGGAGFIGSHLVETLREAGFRVSVLDDLSRGRRAHVPADVTLHCVDICDQGAVEAVVRAERPEVILHQAARADVRESFAAPHLYLNVNVAGTLNILEAARRWGVRKVIFASTGGAIYGDAAQRPTPETAPTLPLDIYGVSKLAGEGLMRSYACAHALEVCILRYSNVYGPRQGSQGEAGVVSIFTRRMLRRQAVVIYGDGEQTRDFVYVGDVARANLLAITRGQGIYNIATGHPTSVNALFTSLARLCDYPHAPVYAPAQPGEVRHSQLDISRAVAELGWQPQVSLESGLQRTVAALRGE
ncbi:MAG: NAD-dependent epimerase/dehydratase family protein [Chloroflexi bacterium]|jgi:UDP-glucose 4-epimerase|uniref:UDP-glucose 4-epimerase n=1 Tax=Candidatus Thermofonsia Clade 3 bacterium TaxID=2364212 RepID=A0A2M8QG00_9CHLR|nr:NAD-dependent epimerase/dehydratase family protein [Candidatus Roseilinea sp. NK_OTU-006]PJF48698.1 MAG: UDP-glucose 4-epimerase [Candidatus Thermofonsia Clade 3 bacterium]RMG64130.1 MAG: NAD-dependent epimerase/dehydratase family protein [Chloroflexota bacterium]